MGGRNCYVDVPGFLASNPVLPEVNGLLGGNTRLAQSAAVGATSLTVTSSAKFTASQIVYVLDGPNSELVFADATNPAPNSTTLVIAANTDGGTGFQFQHNAGVSLSSGGANGDLGALLLAASVWAENYCAAGSPSDRGFFQATRTEVLPLPSTRAYIDRAYGLTLRPSWFPVTALTSVSLETAPGVSVYGYDPTQAEFETNGQRITIPQLTPLAVPSPGYPTLNGWFVSRAAAQWARLTYTAGFAQSALPYDLTWAVALIARELVSYALNPTGAALVRQGDVQIMQRLRGSGNRESSSDGVFMGQAKALLTPYKALYV